MAIIKYYSIMDFIINFNLISNKTKKRKRSKVNINIYMFDALSRFRFAKQMLFSKKYIKSISKKYQIYEMLKYHTLGINSPMNYRGLIQGSNSITLFEMSKRHNYSTAAIPGVYDPYLKFYGKSNKNYVDYNIQLFRSCSESYLYGSGKRCLGNKHRHKHQLEYLESLYEYSHENKNPVFSFTSFMESHDSSFLSIKRIDKDFVQHLTKLEERNILNNSITIIIGDHGMYYGKYYNTEV